MGQFRITHKESLLGILMYSTVSDIDKAEKVATAFLKLSCNRSLLYKHNLIHKYITAAIYRLAMYMPVPIESSKSTGKHIKCRSRVGDVIHLIILLSNHPDNVWKWLKKDKIVEEYLEEVIGDIQTDMFKVVSANMNRIILEGVLEVFAEDDYVFWVEEWAVSSVAKPVKNSSLTLKGLSSRSLIVRCACDISILMEDENVEKPVNLVKLGARLRILRNTMNISQGQMAQQMGLSSMAYMRVENGTKISAQTLFQCLIYYSKIINLDVLFDNKIWDLAQQDQELLYKKVHINSVVHRKHQLMKDSLIQVIEKMKQDIDQSMNIFTYEFNNSINSILALTDEQN